MTGLVRESLSLGTLCRASAARGLIVCGQCAHDEPKSLARSGLSWIRRRGDGGPNTGFHVVAPRFRVRSIWARNRRIAIEYAAVQRLGGPDCQRGGGHGSRVGAAIGTRLSIAANGFVRRAASP